MGSDAVTAALWGIWFGFVSGMAFVRLWPEDRRPISLSLDVNAATALICVAGLLALCLLRGGR